MRRWIWILLAAFALVTWACDGWATDNKEQRKLAFNFLAAYARSENTKVRPYLVGEEANQFGPYPFTEPPVFKQPCVDDNQALVPFTGKVPDGKFPDRGGVLLKREKGRWLVRQVLFYEKVPAIFRLPSKSVTDKDREEEPRAADVTNKFFSFWQRGDTKSMLAIQHRWWEGDSDPVKGLSITGFDCDIDQTKWGETFVKYQAKLTYKWGFLSYSQNFKGGVVIVNERGGWKVRTGVMVMYFD